MVESDDINQNDTEHLLEETPTSMTNSNTNGEKSNTTTNEHMDNEQLENMIINNSETRTPEISEIRNDKNKGLLPSKASTEYVVQKNAKSSTELDIKSSQRLVNRCLQGKIQNLISNSVFPVEINDFPDENPDITLQKYKHLLSEYRILIDVSSKKTQENEKTIVKLQSNLVEKEEKVSELSQTLFQFKQEVALKAMEAHKKSGLLNQELLDELEKQEQEKNEQLEKQRIKNIALTISIDKTMQKMQEKEYIAQGM